MSSTHRFRLTTALAGLLALALLLGTSVAGPSASADEPAAVFYGYVVPEAGGSLPLRVRAVSEEGVVCGSGAVSRLGAATAGFYAFAVVSSDRKPGCPTAGQRIWLAAVYGLVDDDVFIGPPVVFEPGSVTSAHLVRTSADTTASFDVGGSPADRAGSTRS